jgi:hypothetical protein
VIKDCLLVALATGQRAQTLRELHAGLRAVSPESIYFHFWGRLLRPRLDDPEFHSDFASWARHSLHDEVLAERLAVIDPAEFPHLEELRQEVLDIVEARIDESMPVAVPPDRQFHFRHCQTLVLDTGIRVADPAGLVDVLPQLSLGSIFYHMIDARRRDPVRVDDFRVWLGEWGDGYGPLVDRMAGVDPYFSTLAELRDQLFRIVEDFFRAPEAAP